MLHWEILLHYAVCLRFVNQYVSCTPLIIQKSLIIQKLGIIIKVPLN